MHFTANTLSSVLLLVLTATTTNVVSAQEKLNKNVLDEKPSMKYINQFIAQTNNRKAGVDRVDNWRQNHLPEACVNEAKRTGCDAKTMTAHAVYFKDCPQPWNICRCGGNANPTSLDRMVDLLARLPVKARSHLRHMMSFPKWNGKDGVAAYAYGPDFALVSDIKDHYAVMIHELMHVLDKGDHQSQAYKDAVNKDSCVISQYALTNMAENYAGMGNLVFIEALEPKNWEQLRKEWDIRCMENQWKHARAKYLDMFKPGGTCPERKEKDSKDVWVKRRSLMTREPVPDETEEGKRHGWVRSVETMEALLGRRAAEDTQNNDEYEVFDVDRYPSEDEDEEEDGQLVGKYPNEEDDEELSVD